ncbi:hypothetical protein GJW-30_1_02316 [Variibacter gotjawalensis]|uniref:Secreted protein n=1 Tax=Variibacter gotjawalensis TaxID=1333996 RepID=A0A0S3PV23_9BRAD|nr:hypothetical protein [Variibacter gotjawalensis]NIK50109.1 hypothetical protein [Variibacter gotjawalensis]RZS46108.1 hypothetical protein EV661_4434 [Variibacter gotjawalensis]BAT59783.1 hypothetical protein GJW-30_1_02316 [Variibacter gotjawalensis]
MSRVSFVRLTAVCGLALGTALLAAPGTSSAADLDDYGPRYARPYPPPEPQYERRAYEPPPPPVYRERRVEFDADGCRISYRRYVDDDGREVSRRVRDCDRVASRPWDEPRYAPPPPRYDYDYRPPRPVGPPVDDDLD